MTIRNKNLIHSSAQQTPLRRVVPLRRREAIEPPLGTALFKRLLPVTALLTLAACGVDGPPVPPEPTPKTGISITGSAEIGISG